MVWVPKWKLANSGFVVFEESKVYSQCFHPPSGYLSASLHSHVGVTFPNQISKIFLKQGLHINTDKIKILKLDFRPTCLIVFISRQKCLAQNLLWLMANTQSKVQTQWTHFCLTHSSLSVSFSWLPAWSLFLQSVSLLFTTSPFAVWFVTTLSHADICCNPVPCLS